MDVSHSCSAARKRSKTVGPRELTVVYSILQRDKSSPSPLGEYTQGGDGATRVCHILISPPVPADAVPRVKVTTVSPVPPTAAATRPPTFHTGKKKPPFPLFLTAKASDHLRQHRHQHPQKRHRQDPPRRYFPPSPPPPKDPILTHPFPPDRILLRPTRARVPRARAAGPR